MLYEIRSDAFKCNGKVREPIRFNENLSVVLGTETGTNSIGKSTILLVIDFAFGGIDYINLQKDLISIVGAHVIDFTFKFNKEFLYFSRSTDNYKEVTQWKDEIHSSGATLSLKNYQKLIAEKYQLSKGLTLRGALGPSFRIGNKDSALNLGHPLNAVGQQSQKVGIDNLLKLCGMYDGIKDAQEEKNIAKSKLATFKKSSQFKYIQIATSERAVQQNEKEIKELEGESEMLSEKSDVNLNSLDAVKLRAMTPTKLRIEGFQDKREEIESEIKTIRSRQEKGSISNEEYLKLKKFFPDANFNSLKEIEEFHNGLTRILEEECRERVSQLSTNLEVVDKSIENLTREYHSIVGETKIPRAILDEYASIRSRIDDLNTANENFERQKNLDADLKLKEAYLEEKEKEITDRVEKLVNTEMERITNVLDDNKHSPVLSIVNTKKYDLVTPMNTGTGTACRAAVIYDLAMLSLSNLPAVVHDSVILKQIEDDLIVQLFEFYSRCNKQVFVAIDKLGSYKNPRMAEIVKEHKVLQLGDGGETLFGIKL